MQSDNARRSGDGDGNATGDGIRDGGGDGNATEDGKRDGDGDEDGGVQMTTAIDH